MKRLLALLLALMMVFSLAACGKKGEETKIISEGDAYYIAPDEWHGCVCLEEGILIDTFSPMRADFLK